MRFIVNHPALTEVVGCFLLQREDMVYSATLFNIAATFYYYCDSNEFKTFIIMSHVVAS